MRAAPLWLALALVACGGGKDDDGTSPSGDTPTDDDTTTDSPTDTSVPSTPTPTLDRAPQTSCDPLDPTLCALPWPSSYFQVPDASTESGVAFAFAADSLPISESGAQVTPAVLNGTDGFSTMTPILVDLGAVDLSGTIAVDDLGAYADADARTVILDTVTGERVPHFVELDQVGDDDDQRVLFLRPVVPLEHSRRYVVGLRGLVRPDGTPIEPSPHFLALRDGGTPDDADASADLGWRRAQFATDVFPPLEADGFARDELLLAWDFHTVSVDSSLGDMLSIREQAFAWWSASDKSYVITSTDDEDCSAGGNIFRTVQGTFTGPRFTVDDAPYTRLQRAADGTPEVAGTTEVGFIVRIPCSVADAPGGRLVQYGHGLLGNRDETKTGWLSAQAQADRYVLYGQDWTGMAEEDRFPILEMIDGDFDSFPMVPERSMQGFAQKLVGLRFARDVLVADPALQLKGQPLVDSALPPTYYGNSQGGILGAAYLAVSPDIQRGVLGVAGMPYSLLLARSADFELFLVALQNQFDDARDIALLIAIMQNAWDAGEAGGYAHFMTDEPLPDTPPHEVLIQVGIGDAQVTTLGAHLMARAYGAPSLAPAVRPIWGVDEVAAPVSGSALVEWYYPDGATEPVENIPPDKDADTHECPRRERAAQEQIRTFFDSGRIEQFCAGTCEGVREGFCD